MSNRPIDAGGPKGRRLGIMVAIAAVVVIIIVVILVLILAGGNPTNMPAGG